MNKHLQYLKKSYEKNRQNPIDSLSIAGLRVYIKEPIIGDVDIQSCLQYIAERIPNKMISNVDSVVIGEFSFLKKRNAEGVFKSNTIYITNNQQSNESFIADIIHEIAHSLEERDQKELYDDKTIENEFLSKREMMYNILDAQGLISIPVKKEDFYNLNYSMQFDNYLYQIIGYEKLNNLVSGIFISPYASTCLREYFANAFENFFVNDIYVVKKYCPNVYKKLVKYLEF